VTTTERLPGEVTAPWCRSERMLWRRTLSGVVVLPTDDASEPVELRGAAAGIWELLAEPMTYPDLVAAVAAMYGVREQRIAGDVGDALDVLLELGALCRR
jgi:Coenzyme PQQ synthesis protein D (PqqD)